MKPSVGTFRTAFAGELPFRIFPVPLEGKDSRCIGEGSGHILLSQPGIYVSFARERGQGDLRDGKTGERFTGKRHIDLLAPDHIGKRLALVVFPVPLPVVHQGKILF